MFCTLLFIYLLPWLSKQVVLKYSGINRKKKSITRQETQSWTSQGQIQTRSPKNELALPELSYKISVCIYIVDPSR